MHGRPLDEAKLRRQETSSARSPAIAPLIEGGKNGYDAYHSYCVLNENGNKPSSGLKIHTNTTPGTSITAMALPVSPLPAVPPPQRDFAARVLALENLVADLVSNFDQRVKEAVARELASRGLQTPPTPSLASPPSSTNYQSTLYSESAYSSDITTPSYSASAVSRAPTSTPSDANRYRSPSPQKRAPPPPPDAKSPEAPQRDQDGYWPTDEHFAYKVPVVRTPLPKIVQPPAANYYAEETSNYAAQGNYYVNSDEAQSPVSSPNQPSKSYYAENQYQSDAVIHTPVIALPVVDTSDTIQVQTKRLQMELIDCLPSEAPRDVLDVNSKWRIEFFKAREHRDPEAREQALSSYCSQFLEAAKTAALVIFSEMDRAPHERTIQPINVGGVAGGTKFIHKGIFFKLVNDVEIDRGRWLYGEKGPSLELANKAAGNDLRGGNYYLNNFLALGLPVAVPLQVLLDYHGFRLIALPVLPLTKHTLVYGSDDAGMTVHNSYKPMNLSMRLAALHMHLKGHRVRDTELHAAGDVEGHVGTDGRMYLLDLARTTPPEAATVCRHLRSTSAAVFYRVFRPEFLLHLRELHAATGRVHYGPLNPDSLTKWGKDSDPVDNVDVHGAAELLLSRVRAVVLEFEARPEVPTIASPRQGSTSQPPVALMPSVVVEFHSRGIPLRHLGYARSIAVNPSVRYLLLVEMVCRSFKNMLRQRMREVSRQGTCAQAVGEFMACMKDEHHLEHKGMWEIKLPGDITGRFGRCALSEGESLKGVYANSLDLVVTYVTTALGLTYRNRAWHFSVVFKTMFVAERAYLNSLLATTATAPAESARELLHELQPRLLRGTAMPDDLLRSMDKWRDGENLLVWSIANGHYNFLQAMLDAKVSPNTVDDEGRPLIADAAYWGSVPAMSLLLAYGADVNLTNGHSTTLTDAALCSSPGARECLEMLLAAKADPHVRTGRGQTALSYAAEDGMLGAVDILLRHKADPNDPIQMDDRGDTVLMGAVKGGHADVVTRLLEAKADCRVRNHAGEGVLHWATDGLIAILKQAGAEDEI